MIRKNSIRALLGVNISKSCPVTKDALLGNNRGAGRERVGQLSTHFFQNSLQCIEALKTQRELRIFVVSTGGRSGRRFVRNFSEAELQ
jgi:hypothetical protein